MIRKLQIKFVAINMSMVTLMLCVVFSLVYNFTKINLENESIRMMQAIAANPFRLGLPNEQSGELKLPYFTLELGIDGELVSTGGGYYDLSDRDFLKNLIDESTGRRRDTGVVKDYRLRFCRVSAPMGTVLVFSDMSSEINTLNNLARHLVITGALSFLGFLAISIFLSRWAVKPVGRAWKQQRQFVADASHELKTPLTVIMTNAELLNSDDCEEEERRGFARSILVMSGQMKALLENMLELAGTDSGQSMRHPEPVELSSLVLDASLSFEGVFVEKGLELDSDIESGIIVKGSGQSLTQLTEILLDNARKYSCPGGQTLVSLKSFGPSHCRLTVSNPGAEIPPDELEKIFLRFYRRDKARSRDGSCGLGLSIAESIVKQHKGKIWAESKDGLNTFLVELKTISR